MPTVRRIQVSFPFYITNCKGSRNLFFICILAYRLKVYLPNIIFSKYGKFGASFMYIVAHSIAFGEIWEWLGYLETTGSSPVSFDEILNV
jgi:hypothetical protein